MLHLSGLGLGSVALAWLQGQGLQASAKAPAFDLRPKLPPHPARATAVILLMQNGGPSQMDTFDLKPGHANGGPYRAIQTSAPMIQMIQIGDSA